MRLKYILNAIFSALVCFYLIESGVENARACHYKKIEGISALANDSLAPADSTAVAEPLPKRIERLLADEMLERTQVGIYVYDLTADTLVFAHGERQRMRPASNQKVVTAIAALATLGTDYRYRTFLFADTTSTGGAGQARICIKGGFDPLFSRDDMAAFIDSLAQRGITRIVSPVTLDLTFKDADRMGWGWCWDDDEKPLTPLLYEKEDTFVEHLKKALAKKGIAWDGATTLAAAPAQAKPLCVRTRSIDEILLPMMKDSDNSMAESLFYQMAAHGGRSRAGRKEAAARINAFFTSLGLDAAQCQVADGSGLSLYNYLTPLTLGTLLRHAYADQKIYRHLLPSLPVAGQDGTLKRRMTQGAAQGNLKAKTGTVEGVSTLSGYLTTATGNVLCFSIMNQGVRRAAEGRNFQDRLCQELCRP